MKNLIVSSNPLVKKDLTILRNKETDPEHFRNALNRIAFILASEFGINIKLKESEVETPLEKTNGYILEKPVVIVPILRAGLSLLNSFLEIIPEAKVGHIGIQRDENTLQPVDYYFKAPEKLNISQTVVLDPMLATGGSASAALKILKERGAGECFLVSVISAPEGIKKINTEHPDVKIFTACLDRQLNSKGYILPGLGDAGDRVFGTF
ncbi:MAG: uracil phosphoribosyltransferase [Ignavibacteria bacterium]|nr:uracil phosphoribosyltransferase [Ignavibacteria bacterium]